MRITVRQASLRPRSSSCRSGEGGMPGSRLAFGWALLAVLLASLAPPPRAFAHASVLGSGPGDGVTVADSPAVLKLTFNEPVSPLVVRLIGPTGEAVTPVVKAENSTLTIVPPPLKRGTHVLSWRV